MRLLLDTNVLIAAFLTRGVCADLLEHVTQYHDPITSDYILNEFSRNLTAKFGISARQASDAVDLLASRSWKVEPVDLLQRACRDPKDDPVLGTAAAGQCACLVTGDKDLLALKSFRSIAILSPQQFWKFEAEYKD